MLSTDYSEAFVEILEILDNTPQEEKQAIPKKFIKFLRDNASKTYKVSFDKNKSFKDLNLKLETKGMLSVIYYNYLCPPEKRKEYVELLKENKIKYDEELREKYNPDNIFKNVNSIEVAPKENSKQIEKELALTKYKENFFTKIINKIKSFFHR